MSTSSAVELVTSLGTTFGDTLIAVLPVVFGIVVVAAIVFWGYRTLLGFFRGGRRS